VSVSRARTAGAALFALLGACAYDLDPYRSEERAGVGGGTTSVSASSTGDTTSAASGVLAATASGTGPTSTASTTSSGGPEAAYPFCNDSDPLDDSGNWNDGNQVEFVGGHAKIGPDNTLSYLTWHEDLDVTAPCVFTVRLTSSLGAASFGLRKNASNQLYITTNDAAVHGANTASSAVSGTLPMTLAIVVTTSEIVSAFRDSDGWHRLDSIGKPAWLADGLRPVMAKPGDDLYATFDSYNADLVFPSDIGEPPLP